MGGIMAFCCAASSDLKEQEVVSTTAGAALSQGETSQKHISIESLDLTALQSSLDEGYAGMFRKSAGAGLAAVSDKLGAHGLIADASTKSVFSQVAAASLASDTVGKLKEAKSQIAAAVEANIRKDQGDDAVELLKGMGRVSAGVFKQLGQQLKYPVLLNLLLVQQEHAKTPTPDTKSLASEGITKPLVEEAAYWCHHAVAAYGAGGLADAKTRVAAAFESERILQVDVLMADLPDTGVKLPGHYVAVDTVKKAVILGVRGTTTLHDVLTDAAGEPEKMDEYPGVQTHEAMLASAREVLKLTRETIDEALNANKGFELLVTGHSLGAGTAILCTLLLQSKSSTEMKPKPRCFAYAPPPVCSEPDAPGIRDATIYSFRNGFDVVPRASLSNVCRLALQLKAVDQVALSAKERIRAATTTGGVQKLEEILKAVQEARTKFETSPPDGYSPLYVPGKLFWITPAAAPPPKPGSSSTNDNAPPADPEMFIVSATEKQELYLSGGSSAGFNHLCSSYQAGLDHVPKKM